MMKRIQFLPALAFALLSTLTVQAESLVVDPSTSKIEVAVSATMDSFVGTLEKFEAVVEVLPAEPLPAKATVKFDFKDLKTGNVKRDQAMLDWMTYTSNPKAQFQLTSWKQDGTNTVAVGEFTLHGVKKTISLPVQVSREGEQWIISGTAEINHLDFGLTKIRKMAILTVNPLLKIKFILHLKPAAAGAAAKP